MDPDLSLKDDPTIPDSEGLFRAVHQSHLLPGKTVSTAAFKSRSGGENHHTSVDIASLTRPEDTLKRLPNSVGVVKLLTGAVREIRPGVVGVSRDPVFESKSKAANPAHAIIIRELRPNRVYDEAAHKLAGLCEWVIDPADSQA